jgi:site-specific recombinase XerD
LVYKSNWFTSIIDIIFWYLTKDGIRSHHKLSHPNLFDPIRDGVFAPYGLRKTWGYHARLQGVDLALILYKHNHASIAYTKRYLGITDDELQAVVERLNLQLGLT